MSVAHIDADTKLVSFFSLRSDVLTHTGIIIVHVATLLSKTDNIRFEQQSGVKEG